MYLSHAGNWIIVYFDAGACIYRMRVIESSCILTQVHGIYRMRVIESSCILTQGACIYRMRVIESSCILTQVHVFTARG